MYRVDRDEYFLLRSATTGIVSVTSKYLLFEWTRGLKSVNEGFCHLLPFSLDFCPPAQPKEIEMSTIKNPKRLLFTSRAGTFYALGKWILLAASTNLIMLQRSVEKLGGFEMAFWVGGFDVCVNNEMRDFRAH